MNDKRASGLADKFMELGAMGVLKQFKIRSEQFLLVGDEIHCKGKVVNRAVIEDFLDEYYGLRGWDKKTGLPTMEKFKSLGLNDIGADLKNRWKIS